MKKYQFLSHYIQIPTPQLYCVAWVLVFLLSFPQNSFAYASKKCINFEQVQAVSIKFENHVKNLGLLNKKTQISVNNNSGTRTAYTILSEQMPPRIVVDGNKCSSTFDEDELRFLLCHEVGHLSGGPPFSHFAGSSFVLSAEGQADFYAASVCLPAIFKNQDNSNILKKLRPEEILKFNKICSAQENEKELHLCLRVLLAAYNFIEGAHIDAKKEAPNTHIDPGNYPDFESSDTQKAPRTLRREYPSSQCRLDTTIAGINKFLASDKKNLIELRPRCWFNPEDTIL